MTQRAPKPPRSEGACEALPSHTIARSGGSPVPRVDAGAGVHPCFASGWRATTASTRRASSAPSSTAATTSSGRRGARATSESRCARRFASGARASPGAERDIFPHRPAPTPRRTPAIVAYTATSWRRLLKAPRAWTGPIMTAGDCYRFCLSSPHVDLALAGPKSWEQLQESLKALEKGPLTVDEDRWMRDFGQAVHG